MNQNDENDLIEKIEDSLSEVSQQVVRLRHDCWNELANIRSTLLLNFGPESRRQIVSYEESKSENTLKILVKVLESLSK